MGSHSFDVYVATTKSAEEAYEGAVKDALHEHGHDGYNGTISTTSGFQIMSQRPLPMREAYELVERTIENFHKWEACGAIPVIEDKAATDVREVKVDVTITGAKTEHDARGEIQAAAMDKAKVRKGESVIDWGIDSGFGDTKAPERTFKTTVAATAGPTQTRYFIVRRGNAMHSSVPAPKWEDGAPSQARARANLETLLKNPQANRFTWGDPIEQFDIISMTRRANGQALVEGQRELVKTVYHCTVKLGRLPVGTTQTGWLFYGFAAS